MTFSRVLLAAAAIAFVPELAIAQRAAPVAVDGKKDASLTATERAAAIAEMTRAIKAKYVFPDRVSALLARLSAGLASKRFETDDPRAFAARVTDDLRDAGKDRHLYLDYAPDVYAATLADQGQTKMADESALQALRTGQAMRANHGLAELRILPGNLRYLKITGFQWIDDLTGAAYDDAMRFLRAGDAVIIDLRGNGGGSHAAVRYLLSHFMDGGQLDLTFLQAGMPPEQSRTLEYVPAGRFKNKPLFVLIDKRVGSAAEAFAYDVQQFKLGRLVGEKSAGAANNNEFVAIAPGFMLSISSGSPVHPVSGGNWEGAGVSPDSAIDPRQALPSAQVLALKELISRADASPVARADWTWALTAAQAQVSPIDLTRTQMATFVGAYGGRRVVQKDGTLLFVGRDGQSHQLTLLSKDGLFTVAGYDDKLRVRLTGRAMEMQWIDEPAPTTVPRDTGKSLSGP